MQDILRGGDCGFLIFPYFSMARFFAAKLSRNDFFVLCACGLLAVSLSAQVSQNPLGSDTLSSAQRGISLAAKGRCQEALPILRRAAPRLADKQLKYRALMATARCAMSLDQTETAVESLLVLNREFPHDPDVLYSTTHFYSELASRAAQELAATVPTSHQAEQLEAEAFESQEIGDGPSPSTRRFWRQSRTWGAFTIASGAFFFRDPRRTLKAQKLSSMKN